MEDNATKSPHFVPFFSYLLLIGLILLLIGGAQNNSTPFDLNLDLLKVFSWKTMPQKVPILLPNGPILLLIGDAQGTPWAGPFFVATMLRGKTLETRL